MSEVFPRPSQGRPQRPVGLDWRRQQQEIAKLRPKLSVDRADLTVGVFPRRYLVRAHGRGLHRGLSPPRVTVDGIVVTNLEFNRQGTELRGVLFEAPPRAILLIDYGFANARATMTRRTGLRHWMRAAASEVWHTIRGWLRRI